jgi:hypothetical protein
MLSHTQGFADTPSPEGMSLLHTALPALQSLTLLNCGVTADSLELIPFLEVWLLESRGLRSSPTVPAPAEMDRAEGVRVVTEWT